jgi:glutathione S-transferase
MQGTLHWPALITLLTLLLLAGCAWAVTGARRRHHVKPPATSGPEPFERTFRVQMNTLENTVLFLPALWLASIYSSPRIAALIGAVWLAARVWYGFAYVRAPRARFMPFTLSLIATAVLIVMAAWGLLTAPLW